MSALVLLIYFFSCGHGAIDDPDASRIYDQTMGILEAEFPSLLPDVSVMRLGPIDQSLNALISQARIALQLSTREGFEVKVSEAYVYTFFPPIVFIR